MPLHNEYNQRAMKKISTTQPFFLDVSQAFDKVCHPGLLYIKRILTICNFYMMKSYLHKYENETKVKRERNTFVFIQVNPRIAFLTLYKLYTETYQQPERLQ